MTEHAIEPAYKKRIGYHGALLGGFAALAAALLVIGNIETYDAIEQRNAEDLQASLNQVIPSSLHDNNLLENRVDIQYQGNKMIAYQAIKNNKATAVAYSITGHGYAGEIKLIMGVNARGEVLGVRVLSHSETPGLGDKIELKKDNWILGFDGLSFENLAKDKWKVKKDGGHFDQFSGATITPRGVVSAIKEGLELFSLNHDLLLTIDTLNLEKPTNNSQTKQDK